MQNELQVPSINLHYKKREIQDERGKDISNRKPLATPEASNLLCPEDRCLSTQNK